MARRKGADTFGTVDDGQMLLGDEDVELIERGERRLAHVLSAEAGLKVVSLVEDENNTPLSTSMLNEEAGELRAHPRLGSQDGAPLQQMFARVIVLTQFAGIGVRGEVMYTVIPGTSHDSQSSGEDAQRTLPCSIPQGIEAGWRKPGPSRGSVHESPTGGKAGCGQPHGNTIAR